MPDFPYFCLVLGLLIVYYLAARAWIRSRSEPGATVTQYTPPGNRSPAALRYALTGEFDPQGIAATVLHLAARGMVTFRGLDDYYVITRTAEPLPPDLPPEERAVYQKMFGLDQGGVAPFPGRLLTYEELPKEAFLLPPCESKSLNLLASALKEALQDESRGANFTNPLPYAISAVFLSFFFLLSVAGDPWVQWPYSFGFVLAIAAAIKFPARTVKAALIVITLALLIAAVAFSSSFGLVIALCAAVFLNLFFAGQLKVPTAKGRRLLDEIAGYRDFLSSVELDRMHRLKTPGWKPSAATANLAYAMALDLGDAWEDYQANAGFHTVIWQGSKTGGHPKEIRTNIESAWVDRYAEWIAVAALFAVVVSATLLFQAMAGPK